MFSNKKLFLGLVCTAFLSWYVVSEGILGTGLAHAAGIAAPGGDVSLTDFLKKMGVFFDFAIFLIYVVIQFVSALIDPELLKEAFGISNAGGTNLLLSIWQISRNIVNVIFAFMLVFVALYTVINPDGGMNMLKEKTGKFILAVVLVNFSWFFPRVMLDIANVLTATIYQIPGTIQVQCTTEENGVQEPCKFIEKVWLFPNLVRQNAADNPPAACTVNNADPNIKAYGKLVCVRLAELTPNANTGLAMLHGLYVNHIRIISIGKIPKEPGPADGSWASIEELGRFMVQFIFSFFYLLAALIPLLAMAVAFFIRLPILWLTMAFMPFMFIGFVMGDKMGEFNTMNLIFKKFIAAAFLPAAVAIPLAIGFIMISSSIGATCPAGAKYAFLCQDQGMLLPSIRNLWSLLWNFTAIFVMWTGFFAAMKIDSSFEQIGGFFKGIGENWFKFGLKAPLALPFLPVDTGRGPRSSVLEAIGPHTPAAIVNPNLLINRGRIMGPNAAAAVGGGSPAADTAIRNNDNNIRSELDKVAQAIERGEQLQDHHLREIAMALKNEKYRNVSARDLLTSGTTENSVRAHIDLGKGEIRGTGQKLDEVIARIERLRGGRAN